jgi:hypothetical protein
MTRTINQLKNEITVIQKMLDKVVQELDKNLETPRVFNVTLRVTTLPSTWRGSDVVWELHNHFDSFMFEMKEALSIDDVGEEIKVVSVKEVTNDNAKLDA